MAPIFVTGISFTKACDVVLAAAGVGDRSFGVGMLLAFVGFGVGLTVASASVVWLRLALGSALFLVLPQILVVCGRAGQPDWRMGFHATTPFLFGWLVGMTALHGSIAWRARARVPQDVARSGLVRRSAPSSPR